MALDRTHECERDSRAPACVFDDRAAWLEASVGLGGLDHGESHAVFHAAGGVLTFDFEQNPRTVRGDDVAKRQKGCVTDKRENAARRVAHGEVAFFWTSFNPPD